jgi:hypothetical protein
LAASAAFALLAGIAYGFGTFAEPADDYGLPSDAYDARIVDLDRDGDRDLVVPAYSDTSVLVFEGDGSGALSTPPDSTGTVESPAGIAVGRFNPGKRLDLVTADYAADTISVFIGAPGGGFSSPDLYNAGDSPYGIEVADFNRDGDEDVAVANDNDNFLSLFRGKGDGDFRHAREIRVGDNVNGVPELVIAKFDDDRRPDFAATLRGEGNKDLAVGLSSGAGDFRVKKIRLPGAEGADGLATADFNRDGNPDIAVPNDDTLYIVKGRGDGRFRDPNTKSVGQFMYEVVAADFDRDGKPDLAISDADPVDELLVLRGRRDGSFRDPDAYPGPDRFEGLTAGRLNSDDGPDLALVGAGSPDEALVYLNVP